MSKVDTSLIPADRDGGGHTSYGGGYGHGGSYGLDTVSFLAILTFLSALTYLLYWCVTNPDLCFPNRAPAPSTTAPGPAPPGPLLDPGYEGSHSISWDHEATTLHPLSYLEAVPVAPWSNFSSLDNLFPPLPDYL